ncbi:MAG: hypothetical protein VXV95_00110 [Candidatus Thermoplasmatota archaeon]|nr:hypothetical protein [Candidatus Thermoplasmatota archaeon]
MALLNLWSVGHFVQWFVVGRIFSMSWHVFFILSIGWEFIELSLPYEFAEEPLSNKISDVIINTCGFYLGIKMRSTVDGNQNGFFGSS